MSRPFRFEELQKYFNTRGYQAVQSATQSINEEFHVSDMFLVTKNVEGGTIPFFSIHFFSPSNEHHVFVVSLLYLSDDENVWYNDLSKYQLDSNDELYIILSGDQTAEETELIQKVRNYLRSYLEEHPTYRLLFVTGEQSIE